MLLERLEYELREPGVQFVSRSSRVSDDYADLVQRHYKDRIVETKEPDSNEMILNDTLK